MSSINEIEKAIEQLPAPELEELAVWLDMLRLRRAAPLSVEDWLRRARGVALPGETTDKVMAVTRGDE